MERRNVRKQIQAEDLDAAPSEVERLVHLRLLAARGGQARAKVLSSVRRREIAQRAAQARWSR
jgi:hypothetical protein